MTADDPVREPMFLAVVDLLGRTGARHFQIRYCDEDVPIVWIAAGQWPTAGGPTWQAAGGLSPWHAVWALAELALDGGRCRHCGRMTSVDDKPADPMLEAVAELVCFYRYDPELSTFRRACEGRSAA